MIEQLPPGPSQPSFVQGFLFGRDPFAFLERCAQDHGSAFTMRFPGDPPRVVVSDPTHVRQVFALKPDAYAAAKVQVPINLGAGSLLFLDGEAHRRDRQLLMPSLHGDRLRGYARTMWQVTDGFVDRMHVGQELELKDFLHELTLDILIACLFGAAGAADARRLRQGITGWIGRVLSPEAFLAGIAFGPQRVRAFLERRTERAGRSSFAPFEKLSWNRAGRAKADAVELLRSEVRRCQQHGAEGRTDVLATVATARYEDGAPIQVDHAVDELFTMLVGGHETTANTLAWALRHILSSHDIRGKLDAEIGAVFAGQHPDPTRAGELPYLEACLQESMRRTPIAPAVSRNLLKPLTLEPWTIPAGGIVFPSIYLTHHKRELWSEPYTFRPERFLEPGGVPKEQFFPFGGGRRTCIGMAFAYFEMRIVLLAMLTRLDLELSSRSLQSVFRGMTAVPKECRAVVRALRPRAS